MFTTAIKSRKGKSTKRTNKFFTAFRPVSVPGPTLAQDQKRELIVEASNIKKEESK